ncbi:MAG: HAD family hydrolase [Thermoplasmatales archaeon]|nr:HAD family hydrolase [Thermoplasmatales archaeon]
MKAISFDLDGTLVSTDYVDAVWLEKIPEIYALKYGVSFEEAKEYVEKEYLKIGPEALEWYDLDYWIKKFDLNVKSEDILESCIENLHLYPDALKILEKLSKKYELIIISNASREFINIETEFLGIKKYFKRIFSSVSDFKKTKKDEEVYRKVCEIIGKNSNEIVHVGDNYEFDYLVPLKAGIKSFYLDRKGIMNGEDVIKNLLELEEKINF